MLISNELCSIKDYVDFIHTNNVILLHVGNINKKVRKILHSTKIILKSNGLWLLILTFNDFMGLLSFIKLLWKFLNKLNLNKNFVESLTFAH